MIFNNFYYYSGTRDYIKVNNVIIVYTCISLIFFLIVSVLSVVILEITMSM